MLPQILVIAKGLGFHAPDDSLGVGHKLVELLTGADVELAEPREEFGEVFQDAVAKDFGLPIILAGEPFGEMTHQLGQLGGECLFGQTHRFIEAVLYPAALLFVQGRVELLKVRRRLFCGAASYVAKLVPPAAVQRIVNFCTT